MPLTDLAALVDPIPSTRPRPPRELVRRIRWERGWQDLLFWPYAVNEKVRCLHIGRILALIFNACKPAAGDLDFMIPSTGQCLQRFVQRLWNKRISGVEIGDGL